MSDTGFYIVVIGVVSYLTYLIFYLLNEIDNRNRDYNELYTEYDELYKEYQQICDGTQPEEILE